MARSKLRSMLEYCRLNSIVLQFSKRFFIVVNGSEEDKRPFSFQGVDEIKSCEYLYILGSPISGDIKIDLDLHL